MDVRERGRQATRIGGRIVVAVLALGLVAGPMADRAAAETAPAAIASPDALTAALADARGGETLVLADGHYGTLRLENRRFEPPLTVRAATPERARFDRVLLTGVSGLVLEGMHIDNPENGGRRSALVDITGPSANIRLAGLRINGVVDDVYTGHFGVRAAGVRGLTVTGSYVHDVNNGIAVFASEEVHIASNRIERIGTDAMKLGNSRAVTIENNIGPRFMYPPPGAHDDFLQVQGAPSRQIVVRGNVFLPANHGASQGIFFGGKGVHDSILIEQNIIQTGLLRGISVERGTNVVIRHNTVLDIAGQNAPRTAIIAPGDAVVEHNIWSEQRGERRGTNLIVQYRRPGAPLHYSQLFRGARGQRGLTPADLVPPDGRIRPDGPGAARRLAEFF